METSQIVFYFILLLFILLQIKKYFAKKSLTNLSVAVVKQMLKNGNVVLLDVRTTQERKTGSIKPSIHIPLHEISRQIDQLQKYKEKQIICYCQSGSRSVSAAIKLKKLGFNSANMMGGYSSW